MAYEFNGTNQFLNTPTTSAVVSGMPLTMACWFYPANTTDLLTLMAMSPQWSNASNPGFYNMFAHGAASGDPVSIGTDSAGNTNALSTSGYTANTWHHACGVFTSTTSRTVYLNGGNSATNTFSHSPNSPVEGLRIGQFVTSFERRMNGRIGECGIWSAALTQPEIASLAAGYTCDKIRPQSLVAYFPLVRDLVELKGGLTVTNNNTATVANHPRVYA